MDGQRSVIRLRLEASWHVLDQKLYYMLSTFFVHGNNVDGHFILVILEVDSVDSFVVIMISKVDTQQGAECGSHHVPFSCHHVQYGISL